MENLLGFAHFSPNTDVVARTVLCLMLIDLIVTWYLIATRRPARAAHAPAQHGLLAAFWDPILESVAARIRENGTTGTFSHLDTTVSPPSSSTTARRAVASATPPA